MVWFMNINLTDDRTTVGSYDNRSSGGVFLMPKEQHIRGGAPIQPHANAHCASNPEGVSGTGRGTVRDVLGLAETPRAERCSSLRHIECRVESRAPSESACWTRDLGSMLGSRRARGSSGRRRQAATRPCVS